MNITDLFSDKSIKPGHKTGIVAQWLTDELITPVDLITYASQAKEADKATCIEALEYVTKGQPEKIDLSVFHFVVKSLKDKAPRIKWESARVIGNTAKLFPEHLEEAISALLANSEHPGTVVRWSAAFALGEIIKMKTDYNPELLPAVDAIMSKEEKNSIRKIYLDAIKKVTAGKK